MLQSLIFLLNQIIEHAWMTASAVLKYYLAGLIAYKAYTKDFSVEGLQESILDQSRVIVYSTVLFGILLFVVSINLSYKIAILSQIVALVYFGFLFYSY